MNLDHIHAHALLQNIQDTTPGGIRREQFVRAHPLKTALALFPFVAFMALLAFAIVTRTH